MTSLTSLIERIEAATEGSRELDCDICVAVGWFRRDPARNHYDFNFDYVDIRDPQHDRLPGHGGDQLVPNLSTSLDAALTLLPDGHAVTGLMIWPGERSSLTLIKTHYRPFGKDRRMSWIQEAGCRQWPGNGATAPLALLAAILRARQTEGRG